LEGHSGNSKLFLRGPREHVQAFTLKEDICVAKAYAIANDQYGPGGGTQFYITAKDRKRIEQGAITKLTIP